MIPAKTVYAVGFLKSLVVISRRHGVFLCHQLHGASLCRCWFETFFVRIKHRGELPLFFLFALNTREVDAIFLCVTVSGLYGRRFCLR